MKIFRIFPILTILATIAILASGLSWLSAGPTNHVPTIGDGYRADLPPETASSFFSQFFLASIILLPLAGAAFWLQFQDTESKVFQWTIKRHIGHFAFKSGFFLFFCCVFHVYVMALVSSYKEKQFDRLPQGRSVIATNTGIRVPFAALRGDQIVPFTRVMRGYMIANNQGAVFIPWADIEEWIVNPQRGKGSPTYQIKFSPYLFDGKLGTELEIDRSKIHNHDAKIIEIARTNLPPKAGSGPLNLAVQRFVLKDRPLRQYFQR